MLTFQFKSISKTYQRVGHVTHFPEVSQHCQHDRRSPPRGWSWRLLSLKPCCRLDRGLQKKNVIKKLFTLSTREDHFTMKSNYFLRHIALRHIFWWKNYKKRVKNINFCYIFILRHTFDNGLQRVLIGLQRVCDASRVLMSCYVVITFWLISDWSRFYHVLQVKLMSHTCHVSCFSCVKLFTNYWKIKNDTKIWTENLKLKIFDFILRSN